MPQAGRQHVNVAAILVRARRVTTLRSLLWSDLVTELPNDHFHVILQWEEEQRECFITIKEMWKKVE